jgi:hypothetical protein
MRKRGNVKEKGKKKRDKGKTEVERVKKSKEANTYIGKNDAQGENIGMLWKGENIDSAMVGGPGRAMVFGPIYSGRNGINAHNRISALMFKCSSEKAT